MVTGVAAERSHGVNQVREGMVGLPGDRSDGAYRQGLKKAVDGERTACEMALPLGWGVGRKGTETEAELSRSPGF